MCLFPGMGGMNMQPVVPPTEAGLKHKQRLYILIIVHLILAITYMFVSITGGLFELITVLILWCATSQMQFCQLIIYMILCLNNLIGSLAGIGLLLQTGKFASCFSSGFTSFAVVLLLIFIVFYAIAVYVAFQAYREFKGTMHDNGMGGAGGGIGNMMMGGGGAR